MAKFNPENAYVQNFVPSYPGAGNSMPRPPLPSHVARYAASAYPGMAMGDEKAANITNPMPMNPAAARAGAYVNKQTNLARMMVPNLQGQQLADSANTRANQESAANVGAVNTATEGAKGANEFMKQSYPGMLTGQQNKNELDKQMI